MRSVGIICEYNPFHNGHKHQIDTLRKMGYDCIACVMSGNYTQRGELTVFDKYTRAESAIIGGASIVLELPFPFSSFSAERFAAAGVFILDALGIDSICFGSECASTETLVKAANAVDSPEFAQIYAEHAKSGNGSAKAYFEAIRHLSNDTTELHSNDLLGISYIRAIQKLEHPMKTVVLKRDGAEYGDASLHIGIAPSATALRAAINNGGDVRAALDGYVPNEVADCLAEAQKRNQAPILLGNVGNEILSFFKLMTPQEIKARAISRSGGGQAVAEDGCGICERICRCARQASSFEEFLQLARNSKYTDARINRVILFSVFGVSDNVALCRPDHTMLLASDSTGRKLLSNIRKSSEIAIITKPSNAPTDTVQAVLSRAADSFYASAMPCRASSDIFIKKKPYIAMNVNNKIFTN